MFDLNQSLCNWRQELLRSGAYSQDDIEELEEHLRQEMASLAQIGLSGEEAFLVATLRLGEIDHLNGEYAKVNAPRIWTNRSHWMAIGVLIYLVAAVAAGVMQRVLATGAAIASVNPYIVGVLSPLTSVAVMALAVVLTCVVVSRRAARQDARRWGPATKWMLFLGILLWFTLLPVGGMAAAALGCNYGLPVDMARITIGAAIGSFAFSALLPLAIAAWILKTRPACC